MTAARASRVSWRHWLPAIATAALLIYVVVRLGEVERLLHILRNADWRWLPLALACEGLFQCNEGTIYWVMYRIMGHRPRLRQAIQLTLAASFVNRIAPSAGVSGTTLFAERMSRAGVPSAATVSVNAARYILDYGAFVAVLGAGMVYLSRHHELTSLEMRGALVFGALLLAIAAALVVLIPRRNAISRLVSGAGRASNWITRRLAHRTLVPEEAVARHIEEVFAAVALLARARSRIGVLIVMGLLIHLFDLTGIYIIFLAVGYRAHLGVVVAGYGLAYLAGYVSFVPSGLGVFETAMTMVYVSLGIPVETAVLVTLVYRLVSLWLPLLAGYILLQLALRDS